MLLDWVLLCGTVSLFLPQTQGTIPEQEKNTIFLFRKISPSVVHISPAKAPQKTGPLNLQKLPQGVGSGIIWDEKGHIVTSHRVLLKGDEFKVTLEDKSTHEAILVGSAPEQGLAVLRIDPPKHRLQPILLGTAKDLQIGQTALAIGNPFGLEQTLSVGVVSGRIKNRILTDAKIYPDKVGGPLLDSAGRLIGINTAAADSKGGLNGSGFAISVDEVVRIVPQLIRHGEVIKPVFGVQVAPEALRNQLGVKKRALILKVRPNSAPKKAGLRPTQFQSGKVVLGDVIIAVNGKPVRSAGEMQAQLNQHEGDGRLQLTILRDGKKMVVKVSLQSGDQT